VKKTKVGQKHLLFFILNQNLKKLSFSSLYAN
jgi:hypothetical protein